MVLSVLSVILSDSIPDSLDQDRIIHGDGGVIYVDYDFDTDSSTEEEEVTGDQIDNVMEHNNKLVGVLKNTLEMQAALFDKLLSFIF